MSSPVFITDEDLFNRLGGRARLTQLTDPNNTGVWKQSIVDTAKNDACAQVLAAAGVQIEMVSDVTQFRVNYPWLVTLAGQRAVCLAWTYGSAGLALPTTLEALAVSVDVELERVAKSKRSSGSVTHNPRSSQSINGAVPILGASLGGWKRTAFC